MLDAWQALLVANPINRYLINSPMLPQLTVETLANGWRRLRRPAIAFYLREPLPDLPHGRPS
jgi:hypothetical protein